jgi:hypothetical protein
MVTTIKMKNGIKINIDANQMSVLSRKHNGELELDFNPHIIHVLKSDGTVSHSISEIKIEELFGQEVIRGYNYENKQEAVIPIHQIKEFNLTGSGTGFFDKQEVTCSLK